MASDERAIDDNLRQLIDRLDDFAERRNWGQYHNPKNLAMAVAAECGELLAELQWLPELEISEQLSAGPLRERVADEMADVLIYLVYLSNACGVDLVTAAHRKVMRNEKRFPAPKT